jgi:hypothetical protein
MANIKNINDPGRWYNEASLYKFGRHLVRAGFITG